MIDRIVIAEHPYQPSMSWELAEQWAEGIPLFSENDPSRPEWQETPVHKLDLTADGYGLVYVKDESSNPTGTAKDRPAWEIAATYRDYGKSLLLRRGTLDGDIERLPVPRVTNITSGNAGHALANVAEIYNLPPPKLLVDAAMVDTHVGFLSQLRVDLYQADLHTPLTPADIQDITNNTYGVELTSVVVLRPQEIWYDWLVHEAFNQNPGEVYLPYGSGRLWENFITWQERNVRSYCAYQKADPRLAIPPEGLLGMSILAAEPEQLESAADKLTAHHKPFRVFGTHDADALRQFSFSGNSTGVYPVSEYHLRQAEFLLARQGISVECSAGAGLALYLQQVDSGLVHPNDGKKRLIISTGKGHTYAHTS